MSGQNSYLPNGGEEIGMTDSQYKGMLLDQLKSWQEVRELAQKSGDTEVLRKVEEEIAFINEKLKH